MPVYGFSFRPVRREHRVEGLALPLKAEGDILLDKVVVRSGNPIGIAANPSLFKGYRVRASGDTRLAPQAQVQIKN